MDGVDSTLKPEGIRASAALAEPRNGVRPASAELASALVDDSIVMTRFTDAAVTSSVMVLGATPAASAKLEMIASRTVEVKSSTVPETVIATTTRYAGVADGGGGGGCGEGGDSGGGGEGGSGIGATGGERGGLGGGEGGGGEGGGDGGGGVGGGSVGGGGDGGGESTVHEPSSRVASES
jgi:hypothetical protein